MVEPAAKRLRDAVDSFVAEVEQVADVGEATPPSNRIVLDVGGTRYATTVTTLCSCPGMLDSMFSQRHTVAFERDGSVFIDRDGQLFEHVLAFLRNGSRWQPPRKVDINALLNEAEYFALQPMALKLGGHDGSAVTHENTVRVGPVLALVDPMKYGKATFRPANPDEFTFGIRVLSDELVWIELRDEKDEDKEWAFRTDNGCMREPRSAGHGDMRLAFGPGPHRAFEPYADDIDTPWNVKAGDVFKICYERGPPSRLYITHNGVPSDERVMLSGPGPPVPATGPGSLPPDGDFVVVVSLPERVFSLPDDENDQMRMTILAYEDDEDAFDNFNEAVEHGIDEAAQRSYAGAVCIVGWE